MDCRENREPERIPESARKEWKNCLAAMKSEANPKRGR
jgi:hypothetical protein